MWFVDYLVRCLLPIEKLSGNSRIYYVGIFLYRASRSLLIRKPSSYLGTEYREYWMISAGFIDFLTLSLDVLK